MLEIGQDEIPIETALRDLLGLNLTYYSVTVTPCRFNQYNGEYREQVEGTPEYDYATFGEVILESKYGTLRINRLTIIYARVLQNDRAEKCPEIEYASN